MGKASVKKLRIKHARAHTHTHTHTWTLKFKTAIIFKMKLSDMCS